MQPGLTPPLLPYLLTTRDDPSHRAARSPGSCHLARCVWSGRGGPTKLRQLDCTVHCAVECQVQLPRGHPQGEELAGIVHKSRLIPLQSLLFYHAQRSGKLGPNRRLAWRGDSCLNCIGLHGEDLTGGYYEAANTMVRFSLET